MSSAWHKGDGPARESAAPDYLSTFALDVDTAGYGYARRTLGDGQLPAADTVRPEEFVALRELAESMGFAGVLAGPLVRSSYRAGRLWARATVARGGTVALALRPEAVHLGRAPGRETVLRGRITAVEFMGSVIRIGADLGGQHLSLDTFNRPDSPPPAVGEEVEVSLAARDVIVLAA